MGHLTPHHAQPKEAHARAALRAALATVPDEPRTILELVPDKKGRQRVVEKDNTKARVEAAHERRAIEEGFLAGSRAKAQHEQPKEPHAQQGGTRALVARAKAALAKRAAKVAAERSVLVGKVAAAIDADPSSVVGLAREHDADVIADALKLLGVELEDTKPNGHELPKKEG